MKKLMFIAAAAAMTSAFGWQVADYRASVKVVTMKPVNGMLNGVQTKAYLKYVSDANVQGYVVYSDCACDTTLNALHNPGWLVVTSDIADTQLPRIFPADLLVKYWDRSLGSATTIEAEGYLFAGDGKGAYGMVAPWVVQNAPAVDGYKFGTAAAQATTKLFGKYNDVDAGTVWFESWMDHAGFGKASLLAAGEGCVIGAATTCLQTLEGNVIGGLFICHPNGFGAAGGPYEQFNCQAWEGTTDVLCGDWAMRKFTNTPEAATIGAADGSFAAATDGIHADAQASFGMLKAAVVAMKNFGCTAANLAFLDDSVPSATYIQTANSADPNNGPWVR